MRIPAFLLLAATLSLGACTGLIQTASISEAYKHYELQQYKRTLELITQAENAEVMAPETIAELTYLKAKTFEKLGKGEDAHILYEYLVQEHGNSQYGYLAAKQLNAS